MFDSTSITLKCHMSEPYCSTILKVPHYKWVCQVVNTLKLSPNLLYFLCLFLLVLILAKKLAGKSVPEMINFVLSGTLTLIQSTNTPK